MLRDRTGPDHREVTVGPTCGPVLDGAPIVPPHVGNITAGRGGAVLSVDSLRVTYGGAVEAVRGVTMEVPDGAVVAVLGSNGAGKSTLLRTISGTLRLHRGRVDEGTVRFGDLDLTRRDPGQIVRAGVVQVPEGRRIFGRLTVEENLRAGGMGN